MNRNAVLLLQFDQVIGITLGVAPVEAGVFGHGRVLDDCLVLIGQAVPLVLVDGHLKAFLRLVIRRQHVVLGHVLHTKVTV